MMQQLTAHAQPMLDRKEFHSYLGELLDTTVKTKKTMRDIYDRWKNKDLDLYG